MTEFSTYQLHSEKRFDISYFYVTQFSFQVLLKLLSIKTPITDADSIRALACKVSQIITSLTIDNYT